MIALPKNESDLATTWTLFDSSLSRGVREKIVLLSAIDMANNGTLDFNSKNPCALIGAKSSIVNYYFGGREGLMAEAAVFVHDQWIEGVRHVLSTRPSDPRRQILKIIESDLAFAERWGEMAVFASYPNSSPVLRQLYTDKFAQRAQDAMEFYLAVLTILISDGRAGRKSLIDFEIGNLPKFKVATHTSSLLAATSLSWSIHGLTVWAAGQHVPSRNIEDKRVSSMTTEFAKKSHIRKIIDSAFNM